jgi:Domain of unknown function (DUF4234)
MATTVTIEGQEYTRRSPLAVVGLTLVTLFIYGFWWYWKTNDDARRYLRDETIKPGIALLAITLGVLVIVPPFVSLYHTGERVERMERKAGATNPISPALNLIICIVVGFIGYAYTQEHLNHVWDAAGGTAEALPPAPPPAVS